MAGLLARGSGRSTSLPGMCLPVALMMDRSPLTVAGAAAVSHRVPY